MPDLLSVQEATDRILSGISVVDTEIIHLSECLGRNLAEEIRSKVDLPPFDNSSMDGFAVVAADIAHASPVNPVKLSIIDHIPAGKVAKLTLVSGQTAQIMTGAMLPEGADAVVPVEGTNFYHLQETQINDIQQRTEVEIYQSVNSGDYVRPKGQDVHRGMPLLNRGRKLTPQDIGMLAAAGYEAVQVFRKLRIAIFSSGDELVQPGQSLGEGQIYDSNQYLLTAMLTKEDVMVISLGIAHDDPVSIKNLLDLAVSQKVDLIVTSAGVSVGTFDFVRQVIQSNGKLNFWKVNMRPGKPLVYGEYSNVPIIGLPGNPVSAYVGCKVFVLPAVAKLSGRDARTTFRNKAHLAEPIESDGRESFLRAIIQEKDGKTIAKLAGHQGSGNLFSLVQANALLIVPSGVKSLPSDSEVEYWNLDAN